MRYFGMKPIVFSSAATRQWMNLTTAIRSRINDKLETFATTGYGDVRKLKGRGGSRLRVGDWRVIFYEEPDRIVIVAWGTDAKSTIERIV
jgi:mRNA interferase RelE/StbE